MFIPLFLPAGLPPHGRRVAGKRQPGKYSSLSLSPGGSACISCEDGGNRDLKSVFHLRQLVLPQVKR